MNASDRRAYETCRLALDHLARHPAGVTARAHALVGLWERNGTCHPWYVERWRDLLGRPIEEIRAVLMAGTDEGQMLRANAPFAGIFTHEERNRIHAAGKISFSS